MMIQQIISLQWRRSIRCHPWLSLKMPHRPGARIAWLGGGGAEINCGEVREFFLHEFEWGTGAREIYLSVDQTNKMKTNKKTGLPCKNFHKFRLSSQNSSDFPRILK